MIPTLAVLAAAGMFALTGCAGPADTASEKESTGSGSTSQEKPTKEAAPAEEEDQSVEEACGIANEAVSSVQGDLNDAMSNPTDVAVVTAAMEKVNVQLAGAVEEITNPEVETAITTFQTQFASLSDQLVAIQSGTPTQEQVTALQTSATELQASATEMAEICS
ncbi:MULTISPECIES: hypothetical protein [Microbacterium]|nr:MULTISPECIES: hypothetical protein [Microbacterium]MCK6065349.1 hypothetical protein [Microbacterium sp. EYE_512]